MTEEIRLRVVRGAGQCALVNVAWPQEALLADTLVEQWREAEAAAQGDPGWPFRIVTPQPPEWDPLAVFRLANGSATYRMAAFDEDRGTWTLRLVEGARW